MSKKPLFLLSILFLVVFSLIATISYATETVTAQNKEDAPPSEYFPRLNDYYVGGVKIEAVSDKFSGKIIQNNEAVSDIKQAERDAQRFYTTAINNGKSEAVAKEQSLKVLEAGSKRALAKQELGAGGDGGFIENIGMLFGYTGTTNERLAKIMEADAAYKNSLSEIAKETGNLNNGFNDPTKYNTSDILKEQSAAHQEVANDARKGAFTIESSGLGDGIASTLTPGAGGTYTLLAPIPTFFPGGTVDVKGGGLGGYLNGLYRAGIAVATGLALIMIVVGGLEYVSTDSIQGKSNGRERIKNAIIGLLLALTSFIILRQINPNLLKSDLNVESTQSTGTVGGSAVTLVNRPPVDSLAAYPTVQGIVNQGLQGGGINLGTGGGRCIRGPNGINTSGSKIKPRYIPNVNWSSYALNLIQRSKLPQTNPVDAASYFVGGRVTAEGWLLIIGGMIECESGFDPNTTYQEPGGSKGPGTLSVGLLQMSKEDPEARRKRYTDQDLKDPYKNLEVGIGRLESLILRDNCITCWTGATGWRGASAYWSVLRNK